MQINPEVLLPSFDLPKVRMLFGLLRAALILASVPANFGSVLEAIVDGRAAGQGVCFSRPPATE